MSDASPASVRSPFLTGHRHFAHRRILDGGSRSDTYPYIDIDEDEVDVGHEATVSKIGDEQLLYLMSRELSQSEASAMIVAGFAEPITKECRSSTRSR
ncbi:MAG TPA: SufD family Fe-S cluster assembly protein [Gaiellaceae bacterium]|nr:SufD family Fe-S cluster assembly protein [Gaiellaceae bacterium]